MNRYLVDNFNQVMNNNPELYSFIKDISEYYHSFIDTPINIDDIDEIEFILNGTVIYSVSKANIISDVVNFPTVYDFIIFSDYNFTIENTYINKKIQKQLLPSETKFDYEESHIKFFLTEIIIGEKTIKVDFKTEYYNFYVVDNIFNDKFILYFLNKYYSSEIKDMNNEIIHEFKLKIIDNNVETHNYDKNIVLKIAN
jgi:hypothetical protein